MPRLPCHPRRRRRRRHHPRHPRPSHPQQQPHRSAKTHIHKTQNPKRKKDPENE